MPAIFLPVFIYILYFGLLAVFNPVREIKQLVKPG